MSGETPPETPPSGTSDSELASRFFEALKKSIKTSAFNRHRTKELAAYIQPAFQLLQQILKNRPALEIKVEVSSYVVDGVIVLEDDVAELNFVYPLWQAGIHLVTFRQGISPAELLRFYLSIVDFKQIPGGEDLAGALWGGEKFDHVEWVVVRDFSVDDEDEEAAVDEMEEAQIQDQAAALKEAVGTETFARVALPNLSVQLSTIEQVRRSVVTPTGAPGMVGTLDSFLQNQLADDDKRGLIRVSRVLLAALELPFDAAGQNDLEAAFELVVETLVVRGEFGAVDEILKTCDAASRRADLPEVNRSLGRSLIGRLKAHMAADKLMKEIEEGLEAGRLKDLDAVQAYLVDLERAALEPMARLLGTLTQDAHRRMLARALESFGSQCIPAVTQIIPGCSAAAALEILALFKRFPAPNRAAILAPLVDHDDGPVRIEALAQLGAEKSEASYALLRKVFEEHRVPQMRTAAGRHLQELPPEFAEPLFVKAFDAAGFDDRPEGERRSIIAALVRIDTPAALQRIESLFREKSKLLGGAKIDQKKLEAIAALQGTPSMAVMQLLENLAKDAEHLHAKDVRQAARAAAEEMWRKFTGAPAESASRDRKAEA